MEDFTLKEYEAVKEIFKITNINLELKEIDITDNMINNLNKTQQLYLKYLQKLKYSLQYTIE